MSSITSEFVETTLTRRALIDWRFNELNKSELVRLMSVLRSVICLVTAVRRAASAGRCALSAVRVAWSAETCSRWVAFYHFGIYKSGSVTCPRLMIINVSIMCCSCINLWILSTVTCKLTRWLFKKKNEEENTFIH